MALKSSSPMSIAPVILPSPARDSACERFERKRCRVGSSVTESIFGGSPVPCSSACRWLSMVRRMRMVSSAFRTARYDSVSPERLRKMKSCAPAFQRRLRDVVVVIINHRRA